MSGSLLEEPKKAGWLDVFLFGVALLFGAAVARVGWELGWVLMHWTGLR